MTRSATDRAATPLIIDTDPGVDDAFAIALACASPEVDVLAVTTVFGNVGLAATTENALRLLALCGREDVPVAAGADRPLVHPHPHRAREVHGADGLSGHANLLPQHPAGPAGMDAVTLLAQTLDEAPKPVTIVPIGPLTNIALLLAAHPSVRAKIDRLVIMGGGLAGGNTTAGAEFNIWSDPEAARRVLVEEEVPAVLVPLDLTVRCAVDKEWLNRLSASGQFGAVLTGLTESYQAFYREELGWHGTVLHDAVAMAEAVRPGILRAENYPLDVECAFGPGRGVVIADRRGNSGRDGQRTVDVALDADLDEVREFILDRLSHGTGTR